MCLPLFVSFCHGNVWSVLEKRLKFLASAPSDYSFRCAYLWEVHFWNAFLHMVFHLPGQLCLCGGDLPLPSSAWLSLFLGWSIRKPLESTHLWHVLQLVLTFKLVFWPASIWFMSSEPSLDSKWGTDKVLFMAALQLQLMLIKILIIILEIEGSFLSMVKSIYGKEYIVEIYTTIILNGEFIKEFL